MNNIKVDTIIDPNHQQGFTGYSLAFLQNASIVTFNGVAQSLIGDGYDNTKAYVLKGLLPYGTNQYTEGYVLFNGEIFYCAGKATTTAFTHVPVLNVSATSTVPADPTPFSDGSSEPRHYTRILVLADATSGDIVLSAALYIQRNIWHEVGNDGGATTYTGGWAASTNKLYYKIDKYGFVKFKGAATLSSGVATTIFTLPAGYAPSETTAFVIAEVTTPSNVIVTIDASGNVTLRVASSATKSFDLSVVNFYNY